MFSERNEKKIKLPKLNSCLFTEENHEYDNSIIADYGLLKMCAVGWCYAENLSYRPRKDDIAVMVEQEIVDGEIYKYWVHLSKYIFADMFIDDFWQAGLVEKVG